MTKPRSFLCKPKTSRQMQGIYSTPQLYWWGPRLRWPNENQARVSLVASFLNKVWLLDTRKYCYHSNRGLAHCASPLTCQVFLLEVPFILLIYKKKASSVWFSSPQPPPHYFHASPPTCQVLLLDVPFILHLWKEIACSFWFSSFLPPPPHPLSNHPPLVTTSWKENYKSAKCNIAFDLKWLLALSPMI